MVINAVSLSGEHFYTESGVAVIIESGIGVTIQSGVIVASGLPVVVQSGLGVSMSGQHVYVESGVYTVALGLGWYPQQQYAIYMATDSSGNLLANISGRPVTVSGNIVRAQISGDHVFVESGVYVASGIYNAAALVNASGVSEGVKFVDGKPRVSSMPYTYDIAEGNVASHVSWSKIGFNGGIGTTEEDLIVQGGKYVFPSSGIQMMIKSSEPGDRGAAPIGSGAWSVTLYYLDSGYFSKSETITLKGTSGANTVATDVYRVQNMRVASVGTMGFPIGNLSLTDLSGNITYGYISSGLTRMRQCVWTVPASSVLFINTVRVGANTAASKVTKFTTRANFDDKAATLVSGFMIAYNEVLTVDTPFQMNLDPPTRLPQRVDLKVVCVGEAAGTAVCSLRGWVEPG